MDSDQTFPLVRRALELRPTQSKTSAAFAVCEQLAAGQVASRPAAMDPWADFLRRRGRPIASCQGGSGCAGGDGGPALHADPSQGGAPFSSDGPHRLLPDQPQGYGQPRPSPAFPGSSWIAGSSGPFDPRGFQIPGFQNPQGSEFGAYGAGPSMGYGNGFMGASLPAPFLATGSPMRTSMPSTSFSGGSQGPPVNSFTRPSGLSPPTFTSAAAAAASLGAQYPVNPCATPTASAKVRSAFEVLGVAPPARTATNLDQGERFIQAISGEKRPLPKWNGQPATMRSWLKLLAYGEIESTGPKEKWGLRLYQSFPENSQAQADRRSNWYAGPLECGRLQLGLECIIAKYRPFLEVAGRAAIDRFLYSGERAKGESCANYIASKEVARQEVENHLQEPINDKVAGRVLLRQANLTEFQRELLALRDHSQLLTFDQVASLLRPLDRPELLAQAAGSTMGQASSRSYPVMNREDHPPEDQAEQEGVA